MARGRSLGEIDGEWPNRLREVRLAHGLSQQAVAAALKISYVQVGRIERGRSKLKDEHRETLAALMGVEPWDFLIDGPDRRTQMALAVSRSLSPRNHAIWLAQGRVFDEPARQLSEDAAPFRQSVTRRKRS